MPHTLVLFYSPGACSLAVHAALEHIGAPYTPVEVDLRKKAQLDPQYLAMNPQGRVPTLGLDGQPVTVGSTELPHSTELPMRPHPASSTSITGELSGWDLCMEPQRF